MRHISECLKEFEKEYLLNVLTNENKVLSLQPKLNNEMHKNYTMQTYEKNGYKYYFNKNSRKWTSEKGSEIKEFKNRTELHIYLNKKQ